MNPPLVILSLLKDNLFNQCLMFEKFCQWHPLLQAFGCLVINRPIIINRSRRLHQTSEDHSNDIIEVSRILTFKVSRYRFPVTSYKSQFIFWVTSYQREKGSLHTSHIILVHFIPCGTSYKESLHTECHFIPVTSYQYTPYRSHFIPVTSSRSLHLGHFIPPTPFHSLWSKGNSDQPLHTEVTLYKSLYTSCFILVQNVTTVFFPPNTKF